MRLLSLIAGLLPASIFKIFILNGLGHQIERSASVAPILILGSSHLKVGARARIGPLNAFRNVTVSIGEDAEVGQLNWVSSAPFLAQESSSPSAGCLSLGPHGSITNRHYFDASGGITVGEYTTIAGVNSVFMTHGIDVGDNCLDTRSITVEDRCMVGSSVRAVMGAKVPSRSVVAMGSTVISGLEWPNRLYAGSPAVAKKEIAAGAYFDRHSGKVPPRPKGSI